MGNVNLTNIQIPTLAVCELCAAVAVSVYACYWCVALRSLF